MGSFVINEENYLRHYGILRRSGRYPWGSGADSESRSRSFLGMVDELKKSGMSDTEVARALGMSTTDLRATKTIANAQKRAADIAMAQRLKDKGMSNSAIAERMGLSGESQVRALLKTGSDIRGKQLENTASFLKDSVDEKGYVDVGVGVERQVGQSRTQFDTSISMLKSEGYEVTNVQIDQVGTGQKTLVKVLAPPGTTYGDIVSNKDQIKSLYSNELDDGSRAPIQKPLVLDSNRVSVRFAEDGGADADGVLYIRPGVEDVSIGGSRYAQVRVAVDGTHYLKGMAVYKDDLPPGIDIEFNTNKSKSVGKMDAMKPVKDDPTDPWGAVTRQIIGKDGKPSSVMNVVHEEGDWDNWSKSLASQMLSKQKPSLAKEQLDAMYDRKKAEFDEIASLTNPAVKKRLLQSASDDFDSSAVHLKAAAMPRQATQVILPLSKIKDTEIYAPNFKDGERVVLIRYPHGGTFEIPELTVNNRNAEGRKLLGSKPKDAIGIHSRVAERLSGADFDGDTVLVIPNNSGKIKSTPPLAGLKGFDAKSRYPAYEGMQVMTKRQTQQQMGQISNLITDMTIKGANTGELARAVRHSMVVIDAEKHKLNYKQSYLDNNIKQLKTKYQGGANRGASTLLSLSTSDVRVPKRKQSFTIDPKTGVKTYKPDGDPFYVTKKVTKTGEVKDKIIPRTSKSKKGAETNDAFTLSSGTPVETIYATHANKLKALANQARKEMVNTPPMAYSPSAKKVYSKEVNSLNAKLNVALQNAPRERQAQIVANAKIKQIKDANPGMGDDDLKKASAKALTDSRQRVGAKKVLVDVTDSEWKAIQAGAVSTNKLEQIMNNTDLDRLKERATPRQPTVMTGAKVARAKSLAAAGRTPSEIAEILGVSTTSVRDNI